jgi:hypothetical protein
MRDVPPPPSAAAPEMERMVLKRASALLVR